MPETSEVREQPRGYEFGPFRVDVHGGAIYRGETRVPLVPKAVDLLRLLLAARGEVVTRHDLLRDLWPDVVVEEANISKLVFQLRQVLEEVPDYASAIETIPKRGYRFVGEVREIVGPPPSRARDEPRKVLPFVPSEPAAAEQLSRPASGPWARSVPRWWIVGAAMTTLALAM